MKKCLLIMLLTAIVLSMTAQEPETPIVSIERLEIDGREVTKISWEAVDGANSYLIYALNDPYMEEWEEPIAIIAETEYIDTESQDFRFYSVVASTNPPPGEMFEMVFLRQGVFQTQGDTNNPPANVTLTREFFVGKYPVTQEEWVSVMERNPSHFSDFFGENHPVENVTWYQAIKFCNLLSMVERLTPVYSIEGSTNPADWGEVPEEPTFSWDSVQFNYNANGYRLLTEAEWEYAARAEGRENFDYAGSNDINVVAWHSGNSNVGDGAGRRTHPVGRKISNGQGLYDMSGNVREWVWDWQGDVYPSAPTDPTGPPPGRSRVLKGGSWSTVDPPASCRVNHRSGGGPFASAPFIGLRIARNAE